MGRFTVSQGPRSHQALDALATDVTQLVAPADQLLLGFTQVNFLSAHSCNAHSVQGFRCPGAGVRVPRNAEKAGSFVMAFWNFLAGACKATWKQKGASSKSEESLQSKRWLQRSSDAALTRAL